MVNDVNNHIIVPVLGIIFIVAVVIVAIQHFAELSFGALGFFSWIIVIFGAIGFVVTVINEAFR